jgi:hypothetical protein
METAESLGHLEDVFLDRVRRAYQLALKARSGPTGGMWAAIAKRQAPVHQALTATSNTQLRDVFSNPSATDLFYGADNLCISILKGQPFRKDDPATKSLLREVEQILGEQISFPNPFPSEFGASTARGVASYRAIHAAYQAWRVRMLLEPKAGASVVEIGGGLGRTLYYLFCQGITDCTAVDLPIGMVAQACYLGATLGPDRLWLPGDPPHLEPGRIKLLFTSQRLPERIYDLALNVDSLTEMRWYTALDYARWVNRHANIFVSINHERNFFRVDEVARAGFDVSECERQECPIRPGYVEEIFFLRGDASQRSDSGFVKSLPLRRNAWSRRILNFLPRLIGVKV